MQTTGHIYDSHGVKLLLLIRGNKYHRYLKLRKSGKDGNRFIDEELFLTQYHPELLDSLLKGEVIKI